MIFSRAWPLKEAQQVIRHRLGRVSNGKRTGQQNTTQKRQKSHMRCQNCCIKKGQLGAWDLTIRFTRRRAYEPITAVWKQKEDNSWRDREKRCQAEMCHCNGRASNWTTNRVQSDLIEIEHCEYLVQDSWSDKPFTILEQREVH